MTKRPKSCDFCPMPLRGTNHDKDWHMKNHHPDIVSKMNEFEIGAYKNSRSQRRALLLSNLMRGFQP